jgi:uncharacterized protein YdhG (YjbR/CyaY superfamily)
VATASSVDEYLDSLPEERRAVLEELRATIRAACPEASEAIAYQMPALRLRGQFLVSYAAFKHHYSLFPASGAVIAALGDDVTPYLAGRGTIRFTANAPIPLDLVTKVVRARLAEVDARDQDAAARATEKRDKA